MRSVSTCLRSVIGSACLDSPGVMTTWPTCGCCAPWIGSALLTLRRRTPTTWPVSWLSWPSPTTLCAADLDERPLLGYDEVLADWQRRWAAIGAWFSAGSGESRAAELAAATRAGVSGVIALLRQITEAQRGGVNRATQLRHLAARTVSTPGEDAAHALMGAAFGLRSAWHPGGVHEDSELISPRLPWTETPGIEVSVTLFRRGKAPTSGVPQRLQAADGIRAELRRRQATQRAAERAAERAAALELLSAGLGDRVLDEGQTRVLLALLTRALEARTVVAGQITGGSDGNDVMTIRLVPSPRGSVIRTEHGVLHLPGLSLELGSARAASGSRSGHG